jgi:hypothetical protein
LARVIPVNELRCPICDRLGTPVELSEPRGFRIRITFPVEAFQKGVRELRTFRCGETQCFGPELLRHPLIIALEQGGPKR